MEFAIGSVGYNLCLLRGVWHDRLELFELDGSPRFRDEQGGQPGASPFENIVYIDFDNENYWQTNVTFRGRPLHVRSFTGKLRDGILHFDRLGADDPGHVGVSGGVGVLIFAPRTIDDSWSRYSEPDYIRITGNNHRTRNTMLYRNGQLVRTLNVIGYKIAPVADRRVAFDPRGESGPVHETRSATQVFQKQKQDRNAT